MKQCSHPAVSWKDSTKCDLCRYRDALEKIMILNFHGGVDPTTKTGKILEKACEIAGLAIHPEWAEQIKKKLNLPACSSRNNHPTA